MSTPETTFYFGVPGTEETWYINSAQAGLGFSPIDISLLPGPKPTFSSVYPLVGVKVTDDVFDNLVVKVSKGKVLLDTQEEEQIVIDALLTWNLVKNLAVKTDTARNLYVDGIVHVDAQLGVDDTAASTLFLNGVKRANVITGQGDDTIEIRMCYDQNSVWVDDFRINTGGGKDFVRIDGLDIAAELAAGDMTYTESFNKPGLPLLTDGTGHNSYVALGAGDDTFIGYTSNDHVEGGTDDGTVEEVFETLPASGFAYSIGGAVTSGGCHGKTPGHASTLYRIDLATGATTAVGAVAIPGGGTPGTKLDVESLAFNPFDGQLYGLVNTPGGFRGLIKVDPTTAATTYIGGAIGDHASELQDVAFDYVDGTMFAIAQRDLLKINIADGSYTVLANNTLSHKIGGVAIDPTTDKLYAIERSGTNTIVSEINKETGSVISSFTVTGVGPNTQIEGISFEGDGSLYGVDRISGKIYTIDLTSHAATYVSTTLSNSKQTGDGFEQLAIDGRMDHILTNLIAHGGDSITTSSGSDHIFYAAGDGVDVVQDFDLLHDTLHITGYDSSAIHIDEFGGNTFIRFADASPDGYVDDAMIELVGVTGFLPSSINSVSAAEFYGY